MDLEEQRYFDDKFCFDDTPTTESKEAQTAELHRLTVDQNHKIAEIKLAIDTHKIESATHKDAAIVAATEAARKAVEEHRENSWMHNPQRAWGLIAAITAVAAAVASCISWLIKQFSSTK